MKKKVGRVEKVNFLELGIAELNAKIDTGAYGSTLHVDDIRVVDNKLEFRIADKIFIYEKFGTVEVKNSFGKKHKRFTIKTKVKLGTKLYKLKVSLNNRKNMRYPVLIGRRFLYKFDYIVDVKKKFINDRIKKI